MSTSAFIFFTVTGHAPRTWVTRNGKTVDDRTCLIVRPEGDPMTSRLIVGVYIDDVTMRKILDRVCWKTMAGEHPGEIRGQVRIVMVQMTELLIGRRDKFHRSTVVVVQHAVVIIDFHHILKHCIDNDRDHMSCRGIQLEL